MERVVEQWLADTFGGPSEAQARAWPHLEARRHLLLCAPTGSGKTLAGFLPILSDLFAEGAAPRAPMALYVSPLKALATDVTRNLQAPLDGIRARLAAPPDVRVAMRTGDTSPAERARHARRPPHVMCTTPESLALLLGSPAWREHLVGLRWIVVDEVHALVGTKRGAHLALTLERVERIATSRGAPSPVRVGLSATVAPREEAARFLTGGRPCAIEATRGRAPPQLEIRLAAPRPMRLTASKLERAMLEQLSAIVAANRTTLVFTNTRKAAEHWSFLLGGEESLVATHHGSMSREARQSVEGRLKHAQLRCVVASSSLELGIDIASVDHVVLLGSPGSASRALQRLGRSDHRVGGVSRGTMLLDDESLLPEALAVQQLVHEGLVEETWAPEGPIDVLAQVLLALGTEGEGSFDDALALCRRAWPYRGLERAGLDAAIAHLCTCWPRPLVRVHPERGTFVAASRMAAAILHMQTGTIPEVNAVKVFHGETFVGEVDEAFVESLDEDSIFRLAGKTWRFGHLLGSRLHVHPAPGKPPTVPSWAAEGLAATPLVAARTTQILSQANGKDVSGVPWERIRAWGMPDGAIESTASPLARRHVVHLRAGRRANMALARSVVAQDTAIESFHAHDAGFCIVAARAWAPTVTKWRQLLRPEGIGERAAQTLPEGELLRRRFRHVAMRSLLLLRDPDISPSRRANQAKGLLARLERDAPAHPMLLEAYRECLQDAMDVDAAEAAARAMQPALLPARPVLSPMGARIAYPWDRESWRDSDDVAGIL